MVKLLENTFRSVNIGLVNEIALMCSALKINVWEVIDAAKTKPFGFMAFYPGPGLGGHCIPIDPFYLSWKAKMNGFDARFIELAGHINESMPRFVVERITDALNQHRKSVRGSRIHVLGVAYKAGVNDIRESPALNVMKILADKGAVLSYTDPYIPVVREEGFELDSVPLEAGADEGGRLRRHPDRPSRDRLRSGRAHRSADRRHAERLAGMRRAERDPAVDRADEGGHSPFAPTSHPPAALP